MCGVPKKDIPPPPPSLSGQLRLDLAKFRVGRQPVPKENWLPRPDLE